MKPVLFVTGHVPASRVGAFAALHARTPIELALFGGRHIHAAAPVEPPAGLPARHVAQRELGALVASGRYRAVIVGTGGRVALPLAWRAARRSGVPFIFWAALWRTPRTAAHVAALPLMRRIYRSADAVVTYGPHVSAYVAGHGAQRIFVAPQAVDNAFWGAAASPAAAASFAVLFVGRADRAKGLGVLLDAWRLAGFGVGEATLTVVGAGVEGGPGVRAVGQLDAVGLRDFYAACDVLVIPSIRTRRFLEPWGLVVNEAMNQRAAIIASDAVGAATGGLVRHERNGLIVPASDPQALAGALRALAGDRARCLALGTAGRADVAAYTYDRWADGFVDALDASAGSVAL
ncbi:MAG: glycosyltransferase family 4 protein [Solirubrobacteraceae bacterium]|jgi:glycosyltransferase involved in cell wall biosynthesis